jgi:hypothetical protein
MFLITGDLDGQNGDIDEGVSIGEMDVSDLEGEDSDQATVIHRPNARTQPGPPMTMKFQPHPPPSSPNGPPSYAKPQVYPFNSKHIFFVLLSLVTWESLIQCLFSVPQRSAEWKTAHSFFMDILQKGFNFVLISLKKIPVILNLFLFHYKSFTM